MKLILSLIAVLAIGFARAQTYAPQTLGLPGGSTQFVNASSTSNILAVIDCRKQKNVAVQITFQMSSSGTGNQTLVFDRSVDNSTYESLAANNTSVVIAATGATPSITVTNLDTYGAGYIRLKTWANGQAGQYTTNITVKYGLKIGAP